MNGAALEEVPTVPRALGLPRLAFVGTGWIGRHRLESVIRSGAGVAAVIADPDPAAAAAAAAVAPDASIVSSFEAALEAAREAGVDGVVIATPSALHAEQSITALERGLAVFCQKPLARTAAETRRVIEAARAADRLLGVDLSYRYTDAARRVRDVVRSGAVGSIFAVDLVFHNAYGPDKSWFYDPIRSGGGCVIDLGIHLLDLALWTLDFPSVGRVASRLFAEGRPLELPTAAVEDFGVAQLDLETGATVRLACSWRLAAGREAVISASFHGTHGGAALHNVDGSFYDFVAERYDGTRSHQLSAPPDAWGGRAAVAWAEALGGGRSDPRVTAGTRRARGFDPAVACLIPTAAALDAVYGR